MATKTKPIVDPDLITGREIQFRDDDQMLFTLPRGMTFSKAMKIFEAKKREMETVADFTRSFNYRPLDGAVATAMVLQTRYGITMGKAIPHMFGEDPPQVIDVATGPGGKTMQAPWGRIQIPVLGGGDVYLGVDEHDDYGQIFEITARVKKMYADEIEALFRDVAEQLRNASIYRGQAVAGAGSLTFIEGLTQFDPQQIVFAADVENFLEVALLDPIAHATKYRAEKIPLKRAVLLHGKFGTGKTSIGMIVAQHAVKHGWTFLMARPGRDHIEEVLTTARLYAPAVVFFEDIDTATGTSSPEAVSKLLDAFDGINAKTGEPLIVAMTTNHIEKIPPGMLRPGRLDWVIEIGELDRAGTERLIKVVVAPGKLADDVDYDAVHESMREFLPAFVKASVDRARAFAINRSGGRTDYVLTTADLVGAARSLHVHLKLYQQATLPVETPTLDKVVKSIVTGGVHGMRVTGPGLPPLQITAPALNSRGS
jgi:ATPase family protein associated with various cellular activities (AAA)